MPAISNSHVPAKAVRVKLPKECAVSYPEFCRNAAQVVAEVGDASISAGPFSFSTGSFGWRGQGKCTIKLANGQEVAAQVTLQLVVVNSKLADRTAPADDVA
jgi:hypothetical protein